MQNRYEDITMYELNLIYLESKYKKVSFQTYGSYQNKAKIINEYFEKIRIKDIDTSNIENFYNYLKNNKKWNYTIEVSNITINNIMYYLYALLNQAKSLKIISVNPCKNKFYIDKQYNAHTTLLVKERYNFLLDLENKRISNLMEIILNIQNL